MRLARFVIGGGVASLMGGLMSAVVFLGPTPAGADAAVRATIQPVTGFCGSPTGNPPIGEVVFQRVGNTLDLEVHLHGAMPLSHYTAFVLAPKSRGCSTSLGRFPVVTNHEGVGNEKFRVVVTVKDTVFVVAVKPASAGVSETVPVTLI